MSERPKGWLGFDQEGLLGEMREGCSRLGVWKESLQPRSAVSWHLLRAGSQDGGVWKCYRKEDRDEE